MPRVGRGTHGRAIPRNHRGMVHLFSQRHAKQPASLALPQRLLHHRPVAAKTRLQNVLWGPETPRGILERLSQAHEGDLGTPAAQRQLYGAGTRAFGPPGPVFLHCRPSTVVVVVVVVVVSISHDTTATVATTAATTAATAAATGSRQGGSRWHGWRRQDATRHGILLPALSHGLRSSGLVERGIGRFTGGGLPAASDGSGPGKCFRSHGGGKHAQVHCRRVVLVVVVLVVFEVPEVF
mmetsp:Transcript_27587/g.64687  ORF Transcript_27587/g.64687 Transcript_27587/m.64687 type:complete len:238 (+) Transcript_27587:442-1155(+)